MNNECISRREETVRRLVEIIHQHTWTAIHGMTGSGKTHLAILVVQAYGKFRAWVKFRDLTREASSQHLDSVLKELVKVPQQTNRYHWYCQICEQLGNNELLVLDDLPQISGSDELSERLSQLARACRQYGVRLLSTSPYELPFTLQESLGNQILHFLRVPAITDREAGEILQAYNAPISVIKNHTRFLNSLAQQNPLLLTAISRYLRQHNWQVTNEIESRLFTGDYHNALTAQTIDKILKSVEDENARELLYRLCLPVWNFSQEEVQILASVEPPLHRPIERLYNLVGLWVQQDVNKRWLISPLVKPLGDVGLLPQTRKLCHLSLGNLILSKRTLLPKNVEQAIIHYRCAEEFNQAGLILISALENLNSIDNLVDAPRLLYYWANLPLPEQMKLGIRLYLRGLQVATRYKYSQDITFVVNDIDCLLEQASENEAWAIVGVTATTNSVFVREDLYRANRYLLKALQFLPSVKISNTELVFSEERSLELMIWSNAQGITTIEHLNNWIETVEQFSPSQRQQAFNHPVAELGCLIVSEKIWLKESEKSQEQQNWSLVFAAYENLANKAGHLDLWLLWACAIRSQIIVLGSYSKDMSRAVSIAELAIQKAPNDPRIRFLISESMGRQYVYHNRNEEALIWLSQALGEETDAYPTARVEVLLCISRVTGERDRNLAVEFARQAVDLATNNEIDKIDLVKALGELAISQWLANYSPAVFFEPWQQAAKDLLNCRADTNSSGWKEIFVIYGHVSDYFMSLAATGSPPYFTENAEFYAAPQRGMFLTQNSGRVDYYNRNLESIILVQLAMFASAVGDEESAAVWALRGIDDARATNQNIVFAQLSLKAIPYLLFNNRHTEVLDLALDAGAVWTAIFQQIRQTGTFPREFELNVDAVLGNKPNELWQKAEYNSVQIGLIPVIFRIGTIALSQPKLLQEQTMEVVEVCRQISESAIQPKLWTMTAELLEQMLLSEKTYNEIVTYMETLEPSQDTIPLRVISILVATLSADVSLEKAILSHWEIAKLVCESNIRLYSPENFEKIIIPFFIEYWKNKLHKTPLQFRSSHLIDKVLNRVHNIPENERLQSILFSVSFGLDVRLNPELGQWIRESAPGVANLFNG